MKPIRPKEYSALWAGICKEWGSTQQSRLPFHPATAVYFRNRKTVKLSCGLLLAKLAQLLGGFQFAVGSAKISCWRRASMYC